MTREDAKRAAEVMLAYADGKEIEAWNSKTGWEECNEPYFSWCDCSNSYRIKKPKYRPFESATECFEEMSKHQPVGWCKKTFACTWLTITSIGFNDIVNFDEYNVGFNFKDCLKKFTFADGTPFGILEK